MRLALFILLAVITGLLAIVPWTLSPVIIQFGITTLLMATLAQGWNILGGFAGYPSFGNSVFYGLGTYGTAVAMVQLHLPFAVGLAVGAAVAVAFAILLGLPVLRLRGHYFAIATLAISQAMAAVISNIGIAGRNSGLILPLIRGDRMFYELALGLLILATLCVFWLSRSRFGLGLIAIRESEDAAAVMGINTTAYKITAFALAGFFTSLAGGIHAYWITFVDPGGAFNILLNVKMIIMAVFGGPGTILGPIIGTFVLSAVSEVLSINISGVASLFFGLVIVAAVTLMPRGVMNVIGKIRRRGWRVFSDNIRENRV